MSRKRRGAPAATVRTPTLPDVEDSAPLAPPATLDEDGDAWDFGEMPREEPIINQPQRSEIPPPPSPDGYVTKTGLIYTSTRTGEYVHIRNAGAFVDDLNPAQVPDLLASGAIERV